jgi:hypothetical protein
MVCYRDSPTKCEFLKIHCRNFPTRDAIATYRTQRAARAAVTFPTSPLRSNSTTSDVLPASRNRLANPAGIFTPPRNHWACVKCMAGRASGGRPVAFCCRRPFKTGVVECRRAKWRAATLSKRARIATLRPGSLASSAQWPSLPEPALATVCYRPRARSKAPARHLGTVDQLAFIVFGYVHYIGDSLLPQKVHSRNIFL